MEVLLVKMMRLPLSFAAVSKRKQADFPSTRKQQWEPDQQQPRWAAVTAWAETGVIHRHWGENQSDAWHLCSMTDACQHPHSQAWWLVRGPNVWELFIVTEVRSRAGPLIMAQGTDPGLSWWPCLNVVPWSLVETLFLPGRLGDQEPLRQLRCFRSIFPWGGRPILSNDKSFAQTRAFFVVQRTTLWDIPLSLIFF